MILVRYLLWRFCLYWFAVSSILATLFVTIDFFSKLQRHSGEGFFCLASYCLCSFLPTFFDVLPVSIWLVSLLLLRELSRRNEFEAMALAGVGSSFLIKVGFLMGLLGVLISCCLEDYLLVRLLSAAQRERRELIKGQAAWVVENRWILLKPGLILSFNRLDCVSGCGMSLVLFKIGHGLMQEVTTAEHFCIKKITNSMVKLCLHGVSILDADGGIVDSKKAHSLMVPNFLYTLESGQGHYSLAQSVLLLADKASLGSLCSGSAMLYDAISRIIYYLSLFFYPAVTIGVFVLVLHAPIVAWLSAFAPYLFFNGCKILLESLIASGASSLILFAPYLAILLVALFLAAFALSKRRSEQ